MSRTRLSLPVALLVGGLLSGAVPSGPARLGPSPALAGSTPVPPCTGGTTPCVEWVKRNGAPLTLPTGPGDTFQFSAITFVEGSTTYFNFSITTDTGSPDDPFNLPLGDVWDVKLNTGSTYPWQTFSRATNVDVNRGGDAVSGYTVRFVMQPVRVADDGCDNMGNCGGPTGTAGRTMPGYLDGWVDDAMYFTDPDDRAAVKGFDLATNADWVSTPLQLDYDTRTIILDIGNAHFESDGVTEFIGSAEFKLPFAMLRRLYLVDDPATLTSGAFRATAAGGSAPITTVTVNSDETVKVTMSDIHFSKRHIEITGDTRPGAPRNVRANRRTLHKGVIRFDDARARGSRVRGYRAVCRHSGHEVRASALDSPIVVDDLRGGAAYDCVVRAKSRAGLGRGADVRIPRS